MAISAVSSRARILVLAALVGACSSRGKASGFGENGGDDGGAPSGGSDGGGGDGGNLLGGGGEDGGGAGNGCAQEAQYVYVIDVKGFLYRFDPPAVAFSAIGPITCPGSVYSMAVDRNAIAWVHFLSGEIVRVDTRNAKCTPTSFQSGQNGFAQNFGMGFSTNKAGGSDEMLFVAGAGTATLATIDTTSLTLSPIGKFDKLNARAELTGTGDARLFGAFEGTPYDVAEIDKKSAAILSQAPQTSVNYPSNSSNFAFAFWGGDFYLFVGPGTSTDVFRYHPADQTTVKLKSMPFEIVGAGVSTCAPTSPPR